MKVLNFAKTAGICAAFLTGATALVLAQEAQTPPVQMTENPLVPAADATHIAILTGAQQVPPVETAATGTAWVLFDAQTNTLKWTVEYTGLTPLTGHFHGPAAAAANGGILISLTEGAAQEGLASPIQGEATLTPQRVQMLLDGMIYVDIHTFDRGRGEIRGQLVAVPAAP